MHRSQGQSGGCLWTCGSIHPIGPSTRQAQAAMAKIKAMRTERYVAKERSFKVVSICKVNGRAGVEPEAQGWVGGDGSACLQQASSHVPGSLVGPKSGALARTSLSGERGRQRTAPSDLHRGLL